jgi:hypothetical protein
MKSSLLILGLSILSFVANAQFGYKDTLPVNSGIEISYKVVNSKLFDKNSPAQIRLKLKNTNEYAVNVKFEIEYSVDLTKSYSSGGLEICIPVKTARTGKMSGLVFELNTTDKEIFEAENAEWEFLRFDVEQIENCENK